MRTKLKKVTKITKEFKKAPVDFPDGWDTEWQPSFEEVAIASKPAQKYKKNELVMPPAGEEPDGWEETRKSFALENTVYLATTALEDAVKKYAKAEHDAWMDDVQAGFGSDHCRHNPCEANIEEYKIREAAANLSSLILSQASKELDTAFEKYKTAFHDEAMKSNQVTEEESIF